MLKTLPLFLPLILCSALVAPSLGGEAGTDDMVLVDEQAGISISKRDILHYFAPYGPGRRLEAMSTPPNIEMALERLYVVEALSREAQGSPLVPAEQAEWMAQQSSARSLMQEYVSAETALALADADWESLAQEYYSLNKQSFLTEPEVRTRHLLIALEDRRIFDAVQIAEGVRNRLLTGEDFESLVREYSEGPSADDGGDLGFTKPGQLIPDLERALRKMQVGEVSDLIVSSFGVHLIELVERKEPVQKPFSAVKDDIQKQLRGQREATLREALILEQKRAAGSDEVFVDKAWIELLRDPATRGAAIKSVTAD